MIKSGKKIILAGVVSIFSVFAFTTDRDFELTKNMELFSSVLKEINTHYVEDISPLQLLKTGVKAMLKSLDPYTVYIAEEEIEDYRTSSTGQYAGIGAITRTVGGKHRVFMIYPDYPADKAGLQIGDEIVAVNGVVLAEKTESEISKLIRGQVGTAISLKVFRPFENKDFELEVTRKKITIKSIPNKKLFEDNIGYLKIRSFTKNLGAEVQETVEQLIDDGAESIILDFRGNPGGLLDEAVRVCNVFLPKGKLVVETKGRLKNLTRPYHTMGDPLDTDIPIVVLVNENSASASEIVAGVVQDYDRGVIVGNKSFGKGLVQISRNIVYNSQVRVTSSRYYIPSGRCIQKIVYSKLDEQDTAGTFYTANGRKVYNNGGIEPDTSVVPRQYSDYANYLITSGLMLDYATKYHFEHKSIAEASNFELNEEEWQGFKEWLTENATYKTKLDSLFDELSKLDLSEGENDKLDVIKKLAEQKNQQLDKVSTDEIKFLLEKEIVAQYYLSDGVWEHEVAQDDQLIAAKNIILDSVVYTTLLN